MCSWGSICLDGVKSSAPDADTVGILARSVDDLKLFAYALQLFPQPSAPKKQKPVNQCQFAFVMTDEFEKQASDDLKLVWDTAKKTLVATGASVEDLDLGEKYEGWMSLDGRLSGMCGVEGKVALHREMVDDKLVGKMGKGVYDWCNDEMSPEAFLQAKDTLASLRPDFDAIVKQYDAIITPTAPSEAPRPGSTAKPYHFSSLWT
jgi:Asp-tRNA(Asn)/Glu-tRNA(Gln) amidotransferase A subunit family amidase